MQKYVEVNMDDFEDIKTFSKDLSFLLDNRYDISYVRVIGDSNAYGIHLEKQVD